MNSVGDCAVTALANRRTARTNTRRVGIPNCPFLFVSMEFAATVPMQFLARAAAMQQIPRLAARDTAWHNHRSKRTRMKKENRPPVIVAGGGIGGLSVALTLHQIGVPCI